MNELGGRGRGMCMYVRGDYDVCGVCVTSQELLECMPFLFLNFVCICHG